MELHFLEVPKFKKKPVNEMTSIERWLAYFSNKLDEKEMEELAMSEAAIQTALDATAIFMQDDNERLKYLNREMAIWDYESDKAAWTTEGERNIVQNMIRKGFDDATINVATSWSINDIKAERDKLSV